MSFPRKRESTRHPEHIRFAQCKLREGSKNEILRPLRYAQGPQDDE